MWHMWTRDTFCRPGKVTWPRSESYNQFSLKLSNQEAWVWLASLVNYWGHKATSTRQRWRPIRGKKDGTSGSSVRQRLVVQNDLLSRFERRHPQVRAAGASEGVAEVTLSTDRMKVSMSSLIRGDRNQSTLTLPQADFGRLVFCLPLLSSSSSSARPHVLHRASHQPLIKTQRGL